MALMTTAQTAAELARKASLGIKPTNAANNAAYEKLIPQKTTAPTQVINKTPTDGSFGMTSIGGAGADGLSSSGGGWHGALDALKYSQTTTPGAAIGAGVGVPSTAYIPPADTSSNSNVGTAPPTNMIKAMQQLPAYVPPTATGINFNDATSQVKGQLDPMFQRALEALQAQKHQDQLNGDQLGMARGGSHSGLAADLQNKVAIASAGKASDLDATRQTQTAQMAQDLVNRGQDNDFRNQQQALAQYLGINGLNLQSQNQNFQQGVQNADLTGWYQGLQTLSAKNSDRTYNQNQQTIDYNQSPTNPNNVGQNLSNQLSELKLGNYSAEQKQQATLYEQQVAAGKMSNEAATYNLAQFKDPNSAKNQADKIDLQLKQLDLKNAPETARLKLQQLQKEIAQIGVVHYKPQTAAEKEMDQLQIKKITAEIGKLNNASATPLKATDYKTNPKFSEDIAYLKSNPAAVAMLDTNAQSFIDEYGYDGYKAMRDAAGLD